MELFKDLEAEARRQNLHLRNVIIRRGGEVIGRRDFALDTPHPIWSGSKTFTAMAAGLAQGEGRFSLSDPMTGFFREMGYGPDNLFDRITVRDLLRMGTGQENCPLGRAGGKSLEEICASEDICDLFFEERPVYQPGEHFTYNNAATYMLSRIVEHTAGVNLRDYLVPRLFAPMGMENPRWDCCAGGHPLGFAGLWLTAEEFSRMGQLLLDGGVWKGQRLLPAEFVREAMSPQISNKDFNADWATEDHKQGYGYQLWMNSYPGSCRLDGMYGQYAIILPDRNAVVTYISDEPEKMAAIISLTWDTLLDKLEKR